MLRKSGLPGSSTSSSSSNSAVVTARWIEKKKEHDLLLELEKQSALYVARLKALQEDCHEMAEAGAVFGRVMAQWPRMFQILQQFAEMRAQQQADGEEEPEQLGQRLVRIPIEELQSPNS